MFRARWTSFASGRCRGDKGSIIVESAVLLPILLAFMAGIVDFGVAYRDRVLIGNALRTAARVGAAGQSAGNTDQLALSSLVASLAGYKNATLRKVVIYETDNTGTMSATCRNTAASTTVTTGVGDNTTSNKFCNIYSKAQAETAATNSGRFQLGSATSGSCTTTGKLDYFWCPMSRVISLTGSGSGGTGPDYLGISVTVDYTPFTRFWGTTFTITDQVVVRVEPSAG